MIKVKRPTPLILGVSGTALTDEEKKVIIQLAPVGFILFKRNCESFNQVKALCEELKAMSPHSSPLIFIDQEGGRVNRINWEDYMAPPGRTIGEIYEKDEALGLEAARLNAYVLAAQLNAYGINVNCLPLADVAVEGMHDVIGDRAFSTDPKVVSALCSATISGLMAGGCWPIIKHAPGHGRATADSHKELPVVDESLEGLKSSDFLPFKVNNECPLVMTAHILYPQLDEVNPATTSKKIVDDVLRGELGLKGLIVSDDLNMEALDGTVRERAEKSLNAGCDLLLHCSGKIEELQSLIGLREVSDLTLTFLENMPPLGIPRAELVEDAKSRLAELLKV